MLHTTMATRGMISAPHQLASQAGLAVLREGGNAIEAAVAATAALGVVYPHTCGLGGDGFWLIHEPGKAPISIDGSGAAGHAAKPEIYRAQGLKAVPASGPLSAATVAGAVSGWQAALEISSRWGGALPLTRLFEDAIYHAANGFPVSGYQASCARNLGDALAAPYAGPQRGDLLKLPGLAVLLERLAANGLDDFYRGAIGHHIGAELHKAGCPLSSEDLARHRSVRRRPLSLNLAEGTMYNLPPPTQGLAALMILGLFERLGVREAEGFAHIHGIVEATKQAFIVRNTHVTDPAYMTIHSTTYLSDSLLDKLAVAIAPRQALPWRREAVDGDTAWIGVVDGEGRAISCIHSLSQPFGSGLAIGEFGLLWHSRASSFTLSEQAQNLLTPGRKPFHTLCPSLTRFRDGRVLVHGSMGADGQPQTLAAIYSRYAQFGQSLQQAVSAPRWRLGPGRGDAASDLKVESRFDPSLIRALREAGHEVTLVDAFDHQMGHAGAIVRHENGLMEGAADPRSNGSVAGY
ncbi:MAG TPA: gamma-glutamyltransferase [Candidatus Sulfotelmatobacter sp.]|jgi:gamma-glutamyltranspeptidase/glutathione hydrolase|nr:gamma-glutamyltransferase [Candidatus Sulfotelmatobacter sp.]